MRAYQRPIGQLGAVAPVNVITNAAGTFTRVVRSTERVNGTDTLSLHHVPREMCTID